MTRTARQLFIRTVHIAAAIAVLASLYPINGKANGKPAGVRTAFELIDKRIGGQVLTLNGLKSVSRS
jgi:hypothetical protein